MLDALRIRQSDAAGLGHLYAPAGDGPWPAILLLHGSEARWGGWDTARPRFFAAHGYLALPFGYSAGGNPWGRRRHLRDRSRPHRGGARRPARPPVLQRQGRPLRLVPRRRARTGRHGPDGRRRLAAPARRRRRARAAGHDPGRLAQPLRPRSRSGRRGGATAGLGVSRRAPWARPAGLALARRAPCRGARRSRSRPTPARCSSVGDRDEIWPAEMTPRLAERLRAAGRDPEVHVYAGQAHMPDPAAPWNEHLERLISFFGRALG